MLIEANVGAVTVRLALPTTGPTVAEIVADPLAIELAKPVLFTLATAVFDELQTTVEVSVSWLPSE
jgi:hypothetical protein